MTAGDTVPVGEHSVQDNIDLVRRFYTEIFNSGNFTVVDEIIAPEFVEHIPQPIPQRYSTKGPEAIRSFAT